jgi:Obg family GTPase CgtA-like protein
MSTIGLEEALRIAGIKTGDTVFIADYELEWED